MRFKNLFVFFSLLLVVFISVKVEAITEYNGNYNFYVFEEQKILIYEDYGTNNFYGGILDIGYCKNGNVYSYAYQIRTMENGNNKILMFVENNPSNWYYSTNVSPFIDLIPIAVFDSSSDNLFAEMYAGIYYSDNQYLVNYYYVDDGICSRCYNEFSNDFENYLITLYNNTEYDRVTVDNVYDINYQYYTNNYSIVTSYENSDYYFYFSNLKENYPLNTKESCGYIALSIVLSYYDTFYNDNIVYNDMGFITKTSTSSSNVYYCVNSPGPSESFHNMLIEDVGGYLGYYNPLEQKAGLLDYELYNVFSYYMQWFNDFSFENTYSINTCNSMQQIINEINNGRPVIISTYDYVMNQKVIINGQTYNKPRYYNNSGHVLVAYGYEKTNNNEYLLRCHTGWKDLTNLNTELHDVIVKIMDLNNIRGYSLNLLNYSHVHSGNYLYGGTGLCPCYGTLPSYILTQSFEILKNQDDIIEVEKVEYVDVNKEDENFC